MDKLYQTCHIPSWYSRGNEGFATIILDGKEVKIEGDKTIVALFVASAIDSSKEYVQS
jgi:hypothetical protein